MGINISAKTDYSTLFSSLSSSSSSSSGITDYSFLSDYAAIKNGSYAKLMKAYYAKDGASDAVSSIVDESTSTSDDDAETIANIEKTSEALKSSADALSDVDYEDTDASYKAVSSFVKDYNKLVSAAGDSDSSSIASRFSTLQSLTTSNKSSLEEIGITINDDGTLSLDEDTFKAADSSKAESLFKGSGSYAYQASAQATVIDNQAQYEALKAGTYTSSGTYSSSNLTGSLIDSLF